MAASLRLDAPPGTQSRHGERSGAGDPGDSVPGPLSFLLGFLAFYPDTTAAGPGKNRRGPTARAAGVAGIYRTLPSLVGRRARGGRVHTRGGHVSIRRPF